MLLGFLNHARVRLQSTFVNDLRDLRHLAAGDALEPRAEPPNKAQRVHTVADYDIARRITLEVQAIDFISGQTGDDGHGQLLLSGQNTDGRYGNRKLRSDPSDAQSAGVSITCM